MKSQNGKPKCCILSGGLIAVSLLVTLFYCNNWTLDLINRLDVQFLSTEDEKGLYNFTVVTAMFDIGRGSWPNQKRTHETYLAYMRQLLKLNVNIFAFVDRKAMQFIEENRKGKERRTHTRLAELKDLPYYRFRGRIAEIMNSSEYQKDNELLKQKLCESYIPDYDILVLSKLYFMDRAVRENPFETTYFMWIDGGYGHGNDVYPKDDVWIPKGLFEHSDKVTFMELGRGVRAYEKDKSRLHKMNIATLAGGFFAGGGEVFKELYEMQKQQMDEWMRDGVVDDDQTMIMYLYYKKPSLFHLVPGNCRSAMTSHNDRPKRCILSAGLIAVSLLVILVYCNNWTKNVINRLDVQFLSTEDEKGLYNFTVVTALFDIGRGSWPNQKRTYEAYLAYMRPLLKLNVNIFAFVDRKAKQFIDEYRKGKERRTHTRLAELKDLPFYRFRGRIAEIMNSTEYQKDNELFKRKLCESYIPDYDIVVLSKLYIMDRAVWENPFETTYFIWLDGGYGHGNDVYPKDDVWIPKGLFEHGDKVTFMEMGKGVRAYEKDKARLHKMTIATLAGGFFAGGSEVFKELYEMEKQQMDEWMRDGVVDDDQTMIMYLYYKKPSLFHLVPGNWYDVFKLFNKNLTTLR
ncbi:unnamed protein product [Lymnaea stagnalis]|uniref:Uncharacterized protein n=1 Tax=Lymnaea stagnalis TaxID=6523 RepID=A0AAV2H5Z2_LYMST